MIKKCSCGAFVNSNYKMCLECGANIKFSFSDIMRVRCGNKYGQILKYIEVDGEIREVVISTTNRKRRKFVADRRSRKTRKTRGA